MRKCCVVFSLLAIAGAGRGAAAADRPPRRHTVHLTVSFSSDALEVQPLSDDVLAGGPGRKRVSLRAPDPVFVPEEPGVPALPLLLKTVALPPGARILGARAVPRETEVVEDVGLVTWTQMPRPGQVLDAGAEPFFPPGPFVTPVADYLERDRWPQRLAEVKGSSPAVGLQLATIAISPVELPSSSRPSSSTTTRWTGPPSRKRRSGPTSRASTLPST